MLPAGIVLGVLLVGAAVVGVGKVVHVVKKPIVKIVHVFKK